MGTGAMRALGREGRSANLQSALGWGQQAQAASERGAAGLGGMPSFYGQPSQLEMQMLRGIQMPVDFANMDATNRMRLAQIQANQSMVGQGTYMPDVVASNPMQPFYDLMGGFLGGAGQAMPYA